MGAAVANKIEKGAVFAYDVGRSAAVLNGWISFLVSVSVLAFLMNTETPTKKEGKKNKKNFVLFMKLITFVTLLVAAAGQYNSDYALLNFMSN